jgi:hypothetical protein
LDNPKGVEGLAMKRFLFVSIGLAVSLNLNAAPLPGGSLDPTTIPK